MWRLLETVLSSTFWAGFDLDRFHINLRSFRRGWFARLLPIQRTFGVLLIDSRQNHFTLTTKRPSAFDVSLRIFSKCYDNTIQNTTSFPFAPFYRRNEVNTRR